MVEGLGPNVSTTTITAMGCQQSLSLSVVQLKGKHCHKPHCRNGVVDTFGQRFGSFLEDGTKLKEPSEITLPLIYIDHAYH